MDATAGRVAWLAETIHDVALCLRGDGLGDEAAAVLTKHLRQARAIVDLDVSENEFSDEALAAMLTACAVWLQRRARVVEAFQSH